MKTVLSPFTHKRKVVLKLSLKVGISSLFQLKLKTSHYFHVKVLNERISKFIFLS